MDVHQEGDEAHLPPRIQPRAGIPHREQQTRPSPFPSLQLPHPDQGCLHRVVTPSPVCLRDARGGRGRQDPVLSAGRRRVCWGGGPVASLRKATESWPPSHSPQRPGTVSSLPQSPESLCRSVSLLPLPAAQNVNLKFQTLDLTGPSLPLHSRCGLLLPEGVLL